MYVDGKHTKQIKVQKNWFLRICSIDRALLRYDARHKRSILCLLFALLFFSNAFKIVLRLFFMSTNRSYTDCRYVLRSQNEDVFSDNYFGFEEFNKD